MSKRHEDLNDRRENRRIKAAIDAVCVVEGRFYRARIFDLSWKGMTLLTGPKVPPAKRLQVQCQLESGATATFELEEVQRRSLSRGAYHFQRIGLVIDSTTSEVLDLFQEIAERQANEDGCRDKRTKSSRMKLPVAESEDSELDADFAHENMDLSLRTYRRLVFQLPVLARVAGEKYRCHTMDISLRGVSLQVPRDFPETDAVFPITYSDPDGDEISLRVRETYRKKLDHPLKGWRIGLNAVGGSREFRRFLEKHNLWGKHKTS